MEAVGGKGESAGAAAEDGGRGALGHDAQWE